MGGVNARVRACFCPKHGTQVYLFQSHCEFPLCIQTPFRDWYKLMELVDNVIPIRQRREAFEGSLSGKAAVCEHKVNDRKDDTFRLIGSREFTTNLRRSNQ